MKEEPKDPALDSLLRQAESLDSLAATAGEPIEPAQEEAPPLNSEQQVAGMLSMAVQVLAPMFPSLRQVYTPDTISAVAGAAVPLANKHGWNIGGLLGDYAEELAFAAVAIPLGMATYQAVLADLERAQKAKEPAKEEEPPAPPMVPAE